MGDMQIYNALVYFDALSHSQTIFSNVEIISHILGMNQY